MGEAKSRTAGFLKRHPWCCFCGGTVAATSIDHQPAKILFPDKHRPKGLEFPACDRCNGQTKADETLLGLLCRAAGSTRSNAKADYDRVRGMRSTIDQTYPGLTKRLYAGRVPVAREEGLVSVGFLNIADPQITLSLSKIGAKLSLATYYHLTGMPAPEGTRIHCQWEHNQDPNTFDLIQSMLVKLPMQSVLKQGQWEADESFFLRYYHGERRLYSVAVFHESIALMACMFESPAPDDVEQGEIILSPSPETGIAVVE